MLKSMFLATAAFIAFALGVIPAHAHHYSTHRALVLNEESIVPVNLLLCTKKEDADSVLIANEQGGPERAQAQANFLQSLRADNGSPRCVIDAGYVTPLVVYRRVPITIRMGDETVEVEASLIEVRVRTDDGFSGIYFSPVPLFIVDGIEV